MPRTAPTLAAPLLVVLLLTDPSRIVAGGGTQAGEITLNGEIVDMACYITQGSMGEMHRPCAAKCARMGQPVGLLSGDGRIYLLIADHVDHAAYEKARGLAGERVLIRGEVAEKDGLKVLTVHEARKT